MNVFIIIPAFNEEPRLMSTIMSVIALNKYTVVVVDDGSSDSTYTIASSLVTTLRHSVNRGMGAALSTGTEYALSSGADSIVHFDADGQHRADEIDRFVKVLEADQADIVLGSRYLQKNQLPRTKKYLIHKPAVLFQNITARIRLTDVHNGFRAMNRLAANKIRIRQDRMAHASEIIYEIKRNRLRYCEVPVTIAYREYGQGIQDGLKIFGDLIRKKFLK